MRDEAKSRDTVTARPGFGRFVSPTVIVVAALCLIVEVTLQLGDLEILGTARLRQTAYEFGGFWPGLLQNWRPNYAAQPWLMFVTYGFLHGGFLHFLVNMITLYSLGREVHGRVGEWRFVLVYGVSLVGGAAVYALLSTGLRPMVGASGALFGLAGAIIALEGRSALRHGLSVGPSISFALLLIAMNVVMYWSLQGALAWETHLGGTVAGFLCALFLNTRSAAKPN